MPGRGVTMSTRWIEAPVNGPKQEQAPLDSVLAARIRLYDERLRTKSVLGKDDPWWSVLLDVRNVSLEALAEELHTRGFLIPSVYSRSERRASEGRRLVVAFVRHGLLRELNEIGRHLGIFAIKDGMLHEEGMLDPGAKFVEPEVIQVPEKTVVMAVIDDGIAIANDLFRDGVTSSRVANSWAMAASPDLNGTVRTSLGRSFDKGEIDRLLKRHTSAGLLDEPAFYHSTGQIDFRDGEFSPVSLRRSHGTHVAALAAGHPMDLAVQTRPMICVSLPPRVTEDTTGQSSLPALALALQYVNHHAKQFRIGDKPAPVVLNFSFGNYSGPHDGTGEINALFEHFLRQDEAQLRRLVLPAGNGNLSQTHAELTFPSSDRSQKVLNLQVPPDDRTATHMQMWMPRAAHDPNFVNLVVEPPVGPASPPLRTDGTGATYYELVDDRGMLARISYTKVPDPIGRGLVVLSLAPNASFDADAPLAPAGTWKIRVMPDQIGPPGPEDALSLPLNSVQVWVRRDETLPGFALGGRQSRLEDPHYQRFGEYGQPLGTDPAGTKSLVRRAGSLSGFACGPMPVVVGGAIAKQLEVSSYSAAGPITPHSVGGGAPVVARTGPDMVARSDDSVVLSGVISAGSNSGSFVRQAGTSVAAPSIARALADELSGAAWPTPKRVDGPLTRTGEGYIPVEVQLLDLPSQLLEPFPQ